MKIENAPIEFLEHLYDKLDENGLWIDLDEYRQFKNKIKNEINKRMDVANNNNMHLYYIANVNNNKLFAIKVNKISGIFVVGDIWSYDKQFNTIDVEENYMMHSVPRYAAVKKDNRICLTFHDDEGGCCYPVPVSHEEYEAFVNTPANKWKDLFDSKYYCETF